MSSGQRFVSIRQNILRRVFWSALVCSSLGVLIQTLSIYSSENERFHQLTVWIGETQVPLLTLGLWDIELEPLQQQLQQLADRPEIERVVLETPFQLRLSAGRPASKQYSDAQLPIPHPYNPQQVLGTLHIYTYSTSLYERVFQSAIWSILEIALITLLIGAAIAYPMHHQLGRPLRRIAQYATKLAPDKPQPPLKLCRSEKDYYDEIDLVAHGFETLRQSLQQYAHERDQALAALAYERDQLDRRVALRTAALQRINGYLDLFSRTLMQCVHLPVDQYQSKLYWALQELSEYIDASVCALAEEKDQHWQWLVVYPEATPMPQYVPEQFEPVPDGWEYSSSLDVWVYCLRNQDGGSLLWLQGVRLASSVDERRYQQMAAKMLFSLLERWQHARALEVSHKELERLSFSDALTGLANRRRFNEQYRQELQRAYRHNTALSVLMIDIDYFKAYNDHYGHGQGDQCLVQVGQCLLNSFQRAGELPARLGGEEFVVLLPYCDAAKAQRAAERLRWTVEALAIEHLGAPLGQVTVSVGFASLQRPQEASHHMNLLEIADKALYMAKAAGRNTVCG